MPETATEPDNPSQLFAIVSVEQFDTSTSPLQTYSDWKREYGPRLELLSEWEQIARKTGGYVQFKSELGFMPALIDSNNDPVFLYNLVELFEEFLDIDAILTEYPTLKFSQVVSAISFFRKISQINLRDVDIDLIENEEDAKNSGFMEELRLALANKEDVADVFNDPNE